MALRAVGTEFPLVNVRVAIRAVLAHIREDRLHMAFRAFHLFVHATERIAGFIVVEFGDCADRPPRRSRMAVLAGDRQRPMRAFRVPFLRENLRGEQKQPKNEQEPGTDLGVPGRKLPLASGPMA